MTVEAQSPSLAAMDSRESVAQPAVAQESGAYIRDTDPEETAEWIESLDSVIDETGPDRARLLITRLLQRARERHVGLPIVATTDYVNTIPPEKEPDFPGDEEMERRIRRIVR